MAHCEQQTPPPLDLDPESPWRAEAEAIAASARHYHGLDILSGQTFREVQQEAYAGYVAAEEQEGLLTFPPRVS